MAYNNFDIATLWKSTFFALVLVSSVSQCYEQMMSRLLDPKHAWFGVQYTLMCFKPNPPWPRCFNLRNVSNESIIERAGLPITNKTKLPTELVVTFSAPKEKVDICGKEQLLDKVMPFTLEQKARINFTLLQAGAEIYRRQPMVTWAAKPGRLYTLIFWDVGLFKVRGWFYNIQLEGRALKGMMNTPYYPPASPINVINTILILLLEQSSSMTSMSADIMQECVTYAPIPAAADACRSKFMEWIQNGLKLIGLQAYYTSRISLYERFRACTEGYMCSQTCIDIFTSFSAKNRMPMPFIKKQEKKLDFYVNLRFYGLKNQVINSECCDLPLPLPTFEFRPRPGDNARVGSIGQVSNDVEMTLEVGGSAAAFRDETTLYSLIVIDANGSPYLQYPVMLFSFGNFKYPAMDSAKSSVSAYRPPSPSNVSQIYILLFSHKAVHKVENNGPCYNPLTQITTNCTDFQRLPSDFVLRAVSWYYAGFDLFKVQYDHNYHDLDCDNYFISNVKCPESDFRDELDKLTMIGQMK